LWVVAATEIWLMTMTDCFYHLVFTIFAHTIQPFLPLVLYFIIKGEGTLDPHFLNIEHFHHFTFKYKPNICWWSCCNFAPELCTLVKQTYKYKLQKYLMSLCLDSYCILQSSWVVYFCLRESYAVRHAQAIYIAITNRVYVVIKHRYINVGSTNVSLSISW